MIVHKSHIIAVTKYFIVHLINLVKIPRTQKNMSRPRSQLFDKRHENPNIFEKLSSKEGIGSKVLVEGIYSLRDLNFVELCEDQALLLGFTHDQSENLTKEIFKSGEITAKMHINEFGINTKYGSMNITPVINNQHVSRVSMEKQGIRKLSSKQLESLKIELINGFY